MLPGSLGGLLGDDAYGAEEAGGDGFQVVHVLGLEELAVFGVEGGVVAGWLAGELVDGGVADADLDGVLAGVDEGGDVEAVGRVPEGAGRLPLMVTMAASRIGGSRRAWMPLACAGAVVRGGGALAEVDDGVGRVGGEGEVAGVGGFAGVELFAADFGPGGEGGDGLGGGCCRRNGCSSRR